MSIITQYGDSALMIAAREGKTEVVSRLLEAGANIDVQNMVSNGKRMGSRALCDACDQKYLDHLCTFFCHTEERICTDDSCLGGQD